MLALGNSARGCMHSQANGAASIAEGYLNPMTVQNAIFGFAQAPKFGRHLLDDTVKVGSVPRPPLCNTSL